MELTPGQLALIGKWQLDRAENFDEYMKKIGIGTFKRAIGNAIKPIMEFHIQNDGIWKISVKSTFKNEQWIFKMNEKTKMKTIDGRLFWVIAYFDGDILIEKQEICEEDRNSIPSVVKRYIKGDELVAECIIGDVVAFRYFKRIE